MDWRNNFVKSHYDFYTVVDLAIAPLAVLVNITVNSLMQVPLVLIIWIFKDV